MSAELHEFRPEEVMAYLDGEVTGERALALADHIGQCLECASLADDFRSLSQQLIAWKIESSPLVDSPAILGVEALTAEEAIGAFKFDKKSIAALLLARDSAPAVGLKSSLLSSFLDFIQRPRVQRPWVWALASACMVMLIVSSLSLRMSKVAPSKSVPASANPQTKTQNAKHDTAPTIGPATNSGLDVGGRRARGNMVTVDGADDIHESVVDVTKTEVPASPQKADSTDSIANLPINGSNYITLTNSQVVRELAPMIEKTASLSLTVKEMEVARAALEDIEK